MPVGKATLLVIGVSVAAGVLAKAVGDAPWAVSVFTTCFFLAANGTVVVWLHKHSDNIAAGNYASALLSASIRRRPALFVAIFLIPPIAGIAMAAVVHLGPLGLSALTFTLFFLGVYVFILTE